MITEYLFYNSAIVPDKIKSHSMRMILLKMKVKIKLPVILMNTDPVAKCSRSLLVTVKKDLKLFTDVPQ